MASAASTDSKGRFQPPKWCRAPRSPALRAQSLRFVSEDSPTASLVRPADELALSEKAVYTIGRAETGVDVRLRGELASRLHAAVCQDGEGRKFLVDLRSSHGTFLGGRRLEPHTPVRWLPEVRASFGSGPTAEVAELSPAADAAAAGAGSRPEQGRDPGGGSADVDAVDGLPAAKKQRKAQVEDDPMAALYGDLPEAKVTKVAPRVEERRWVEPIPPPVEPTRVIFLDIDGVLRSVHGRTDFAANVRTMVVEGQRVALMGDNTSTNDNLAGIDFWPQAMHALKHVVRRTQAAVVLSSDWRKQEQLVEGVNNQLREYGMPKLFGQTPDMDAKLGVVKALHSNVREKRAKEIRKWLRTHPKIERWVAIDDMDLTASRKDEVMHQQSGSSDPMPFLDPNSDFVRCNPAVGLTMELARLAVAFLNGVEVTQEEMDMAYGRGAAETNLQPDPNFQGLGPTTFVG